MKENIMKNTKDAAAYKTQLSAVEKLSPRMLDYIRNVIDTPIEGKGMNFEVARKMRITPTRSYELKTLIKKRLTKDELLEVCAKIMKELE